jgi:hypothetical protein
LPLRGGRGDLTDATEVGRIRCDARELYEELRRVKAGRPVGGLRATRQPRVLVSVWQAERADDAGERYEFDIKIVLLVGDARDDTEGSNGQPKHNQGRKRQGT